MFLDLFDRGHVVDAIDGLSDEERETLRAKLKALKAAITTPEPRDSQTYQTA